MSGRVHVGCMSYHNRLLPIAKHDHVIAAASLKHRQVRSVARSAQSQVRPTLLGLAFPTLGSIRHRTARP